MIKDPPDSPPPSIPTTSTVPSPLAGLLPPDTVREMAQAPIAGRVAPAYVWTGDELLIWGGSQPRPGGGEDVLSDGAAYDPATDSWRVLPAAPISGRAYPAMVWTGSEMVVWGGAADGELLADGAAFDPATDTWREIADSPLTGAMKSAVVWTGEEMIIVGGLNSGRSAAAYDPASDQWRKLPDAPGTVTPPYPQAVWAAGRAYLLLTPNGGRLFDPLVFASYDPAADEWNTITSRFPIAQLPFLVWTGSEIVGVSPTRATQQAYDPAVAEWRDVSGLPIGWVSSAPSTPLPWSGEEVLVWSGGSSGLALDPETGSWRNYPGGGLAPRVNGAVVWADGLLVAWGGSVRGPDGSPGGADDGVVYAPGPPGTQRDTSGLDDRWTLLTALEVGDAEVRLAAVAGDEVIVGTTDEVIAIDRGGGVRRAEPGPLVSRCCPSRLGIGAGSAVVVLFDSDATSWRLDVESLEWTQLPGLPSDGYLLDATWTGREVVAVFVRRGVDVASAETLVAALDPGQGTWRPLPEPPVPINRGGVAALGDRVVLSGTLQEFGNHIVGEPEPVVFELSGDEWLRVDSPPISGQAAVAVPTATGYLAWNYNLDLAVLDDTGWHPAEPLPGPSGECTPDGTWTDVGWVTNGCGGIAVFDADGTWRAIPAAFVPDMADWLAIGDDRAVIVRVDGSGAVEVYERDLVS